MGDHSEVAEESDPAELPFRQLAQHLPIPCWISDAEGRVVWVNDAWLAYTGMDVGAIDAQSLKPLHDPEIYADVRRQWIEIKAARVAAELVFPLRGRDGRLRPFLTRVAPLKDSRGKITRWFGTNIDISALTDTEHRLEGLEARFRDLLGREGDPASDASTAAAAELKQLRRFWEGSRDLLAVIGADGVPRLFNAAWQETLGYSAATLAQTAISDLAHPDDRGATMGLRARLVREGAVYGFENRLRHADGRWVWLSWNVVFEDDLDYAIARDITETVAAREALAHSERQFRLLVAGVVDYALYMLSPTGVVVSWNAGAERIKGYTTQEIVGQHFSRFYTDGDRAAGLPQRALGIAAEQGRYEAEGWRVRKDGSLFWANVVIDAIYDETDELAGFAKITRDMTERREAQLELQRAQERLAQAQKMEAIGQLTGGVAHDFNNLLMVVGGQTELLRRRIGGEDPAVRRALDAIELSTRRGQDLTRHLLAFGRRQKLNPAAVALAERRQSLQQLLATGVGSAVSVNVDLPDELWPVEADASELELALLNMAVNARDAMPAGGVLTLSGRNTAPAEPEGADCVALTMRDTGTGIAPDILAKVFEPFFTTKDVDKGTGLGLSQVYGFAQQSGGRAEIESELGVGTTITLHLPRAKAEPCRDIAEAPAPTPEASYILLVEDNPQVADVAARLLEQLGHRTRTATSASAALALLEAGERPELVFSDVVMAGELNGLDMAREVRRRWPGLPVLLATGYSEAVARMPPGEFPILSKPYNLDALNRALSPLLAAAVVAPV